MYSFVDFCSNVLLMNGSLRGLGLGGSAPTPSLLASREIVKEYNIISEEF